MQDIGALKVVAIVAHGVVKSGVDRIKNKYDELFLTNTIECDCANVDISSLIVDSLNSK